MKKYIPAGVGEKMQYMVHAFNDNTIRFVLRYPGLLQAEALRQAACAVVSSVEVLHASFIAGRIGARWRVNTIRPEQCFTHVQTAGAPLPVAMEYALEPVGAADPVQMRCVLVHGEGQSAVAVLISHLCADGSDGKYLLRKLCEAYDLYRQDGDCRRLQVKNGSRAAEQVYTRLGPQERRKLRQDPRSGVKSPFTFPTEEPGRPAVLRRQISAAVMSAAHEKVRHMGATVNDLLLTACYYAYVETTGADAHQPVSLMSMMDLRRHCNGGDSPGLCNLTGALSTALPEGLRATFGETLAEIARQTRRSKEDPYAGLYGMPLLHSVIKNVPMGLLLSASGRLYGSMAVGMTNIGSVDGAQLQMGGVQPAEGWFGGPVKHKPGLQVSIASFDGACSLSIWGDAAEEDKPVLQRLLDSMATHAERFAMGEGASCDSGRYCAVGGHICPSHFGEICYNGKRKSPIDDRQEE